MALRQIKVPELRRKLRKTEEIEKQKQACLSQILGIKTSVRQNVVVVRVGLGLNVGFVENPVKLTDGAGKQAVEETDSLEETVPKEVTTNLPNCQITQYEVYFSIWE